MLKYQLWVCDNCGKEAPGSDGFPEDWFTLELYRGDKLSNDVEIFKVDLCSEMCVRKFMTKYLAKGTSHAAKEG